MNQALLSPVALGEIQTAHSKHLSGFKLWVPYKLCSFFQCLILVCSISTDAHTATQEQLTFEIADDVALTFSVIPSGKFLFGSPQNEEGRLGDEPIQTHKSMDYSFWMGTTEISAKQFTTLIPSRSRLFNLFNIRPGEPARFVNWNLANRFCRLLNEQFQDSPDIPKGFVFRLPLETEWEHACRAGKASPFGIGAGNQLDNTLARFSWKFPYASTVVVANPMKPDHPSRFPANKWGLHDMHGNVWEMCLNAYTDYLPKHADNEEIDMSEWISIRGGAWTSSGRFCRSSTRLGFPKEGIRDNVGFRVVLAPKTP